MGARFSASVQTGPGAHPASCTMGTGSLAGVKSGRGVTLTPHPLLVPWSRKSELYLYSPYGPYGLYRVSVPVQGCTSPFLPSCITLYTVIFLLYVRWTEIVAGYKRNSCKLVDWVIFSTHVTSVCFEDCQPVQRVTLLLLTIQVVNIASSHSPSLIFFLLLSYVSYICCRKQCALS